MNIKEIKELVKILDGTDIVEFTFESEGSKIVIKKGYDNSQNIASYNSHLPVALSNISAQAPNPTAISQTVTAANESEEALGPNQVYITAPMVGTFYKSTNPETDPYVQVGDIVESGQVVCIIEAMKLMNEIESEFHGKIVEILVSNAQPVEFGQPLFVVEKI